MPLLFCYKFGRFIMPAVESPNKNFVLLESVTYLPYGLLIFLGMGACWRTRRTYSSSRWLAVHAFVLGNLTSTLIFYGSARFRDAIAPVLVIYAAVGLQLIAKLTLKPGGLNAPGWFFRQEKGREAPELGPATGSGRRVTHWRHSERRIPKTVLPESHVQMWRILLRML
jgi:hypothetical protein